MCSRSSSTQKGLDIGPESDPEWLLAQPLPPIEELDPANTNDPYLRSLEIDLRRAAGLPDYPTGNDRRRSAAD
jgi:hypothetical protein